MKRTRHYNISEKVGGGSNLGSSSRSGTRKSVYSWFSHGSEGSDEDSDSAWEPPYYGDEEEDQLVDDLDWWSKYYASIGDEMLGI